MAEEFKSTMKTKEDEDRIEEKLDFIIEQFRTYFTYLRWLCHVIAGGLIGYACSKLIIRLGWL